MTTNIVSFGLIQKLRKREESGNPICIGLVGCGEMGTDLLTCVTQMDGICVGAITTRTPEKIFRAAEIAWQEKGHVQEVENATAMTKAIENGFVAATDDLDLLLQNEQIDVVVDATGYPEAGARIALKAFANNKHLVMMNVETDVTIGCYLKHEAKKNGLIYTVGAGDEPSACLELVEFVAAMGHTIIAAGKGKNNPLYWDAIPDMYEEEARRRNMNVRMLIEFIDGSKTMVEMAALANATGLVPDCPGMHGSAVNLEDLDQIFIPEREGGILKKIGVVDYSTGHRVSPGVFVIAEIRHPRICERMQDLKIGKGPYFTFHRPYHLTAMEVPLTCARVILFGRADMAPLSQQPVAEVCALAKKDLKIGEHLDSIGNYTYRAWLMTYKDAQKKHALPCGLLEGATVTASIKKGELITMQNVLINEKQQIVELRKRQDKMYRSIF